MSKTAVTPDAAAAISVFETRAELITFYEDRAQVTRHVTIDGLLAGEQTIFLRGATALVDDPSLVVRVLPDEAASASPPRVLQSKTRRRIITRQELDALELAALKARERETTRALRALELELSRLESQQRRVDGLELTLLKQLHEVPPGQGSQPERWSEAFGEVDSRFSKIFGTRDALVRRRRELVRERERAVARQAQGAQEHKELETVIEVQLELSEASSFLLELVYFTPCALWRPEHLAQLGRVEGHSERSRQLTLTTFGTAWQSTGERWTQVRCRFSTARPTQAAQPPKLVDDLLYSRPKTERERRIVDVEARDETISLTGVSGGARAVDEMPGVDDGGEPLTFDAVARVDIPSTGEPLRVQLDVVTLPCKVELVAYPELAVAPHLKATATWSASWPLLAGPVTLMREQELAGRARAKFVGSGDAFELGFGVDMGVRIQREVTDKDTSKKLSRKNRQERKVRLYLSNTSDEDRELVVIERIPVSEIDAVEVTLDEDAGGVMDKDGFLRIPVKLKGNHTSKLTIRYTLEMASNVNLRL